MSQPQLSTITEDHELDVLSHIHHNNTVKQRDIAGAIGLSLGMTNATSISWSNGAPRSQA